MAAVKCFWADFYGFLWCFSAASTVDRSSMVIVMGPTPPGTGVSHPATGETLSKSTSPQSFPAALRFIPTSMTTAPGLTIFPVTNPALPTAEIRISARRVTSGRFWVLLWQIVTVALRCSAKSAMGFPTILLRPMMTHSLPAMSTPVLSMRVRIPLGVQGAKK